VLCVNNQAGQDFLVVLNADQVVNHGQVVEVMDRLRQLKELVGDLHPETF